MAEDKDTLSIYLPGSKGRGNVSLEKGLKAAIDEMLSEIYKETGHKFSRNDFIVKSIKFYLHHLLSMPSITEFSEELKKKYLP